MKRQLAGLPREVYPAVQQAIRELANEPRPHGVKKLESGQYRIRVGRYRVIYDIDDRWQEVIVSDVIIRDEHSYR